MSLPYFSAIAFNFRARPELRLARRCGNTVLRTDLNGGIELTTDGERLGGVKISRWIQISYMIPNSRPRRAAWVRSRTPIFCNTLVT